MEYDQLWDRITALEKDRSRSVSKKAIFVASKFRKYFDKPQCDWMRHVPANNLMTFASRDEAFEAGLKPCKTCRA